MPPERINLIAGHLFLDKNQSDLYNKSGIYTLYEHFQNTNNVNTKVTPVSSMYDDFKTNNLNKYSYNYTDSINVFNNDIVNCVVVGLNEGSSSGYLQFSLLPLEPVNLSILFYNPNHLDLAAIEQYFLNNYSLYLNNTNLDIVNYYIDNPVSYLYKYSQIVLQLEVSILSTIKIVFNTDYNYSSITNIITSSI